MREAGIFRSFQALSPEAENVSVRIISKIIKAKLVNDSEKDFDLMLKKFRDGDRSVFLRAMKEDIYSNIIHASKNNKDIEDACKRFENLVNVVYKNIENKDDDFSKAIRATEVFDVFFHVFKKK